MPTPLEHILLRDEWNEVDDLVLRRAVVADPALGVALHRWIALSAEAASCWEAEVPSRKALVLLACQDRFTSAELNAEERVLLDAASCALSTALERHPAVRDVIDRIGQEANAFDQAWAAFIAEPTPTPRLRTDRSSVRRGMVGPKHESPSGSLRSIRLVMATAAVFAILMVARSWLGTDGPVPTATYTTQEAMQIVLLDDGSQVRLAPRAMLEVLHDETSEERRVRLHGDGFFEVAPGPHPFRVETSNAVTTVLGTTFGIRTGEGTDVLLVSGRVSLTSLEGSHEAIVLSPGEQGILSPDKRIPQVRTFDILDGFEWTGLLVFRNTPMQTVAERLSEVFDVPITVSEELREAPLTGTFESDRGSKVILEIIASALGATLTQRPDGGIHVSR
jgi:transmembrane sensor